MPVEPGPVGTTREFDGGQVVQAVFVKLSHIGQVLAQQNLELPVSVTLKGFALFAVQEHAVDCPIFVLKYGPLRNWHGGQSLAAKTADKTSTKIKLMISFITKPFKTPVQDWRWETTDLSEWTSVFVNCFSFVYWSFYEIYLPKKLK